MPRDLTKAQITALTQAYADGGEIIMSGIDQTNPCPRRDVVERLVIYGYLKVWQNAQTGFSIGLRDYFILTDEGRRIAKEQTDAAAN